MLYLPATNSYLVLDEKPTMFDEKTPTVRAAIVKKTLAALDANANIVLIDSGSITSPRFAVQQLNKLGIKSLVESETVANEQVDEAVDEAAEVDDVESADEEEDKEDDEERASK